MEKTIIIVTHNSREIEANSNIIYLEQDTESKNPTPSSIPDLAP